MSSQQPPDDNNKDDDDSPMDPQQSERLRETLDTLHREMDVAEYSRTKGGQRKRVTPKELSKGKTRKRKLLEQEDAKAMEEEDEEESDSDDDNGDNNNRNKTARLRGSRVSLEDAVIEGSLPLAAASRSRQSSQQQGEDEEGGSEDEDEDDSGDEEEEDDDEDAGSGEEEEDQEMEEEAGEQRKIETKDAAAAPAKKTRGPYKKRSAADKKSKKDKKPGSNSKKGRRRLYKLKNFKSFRMAQRHGDALGAHARGLPQLAIAELKKVARDAPSAPQVYSSLGMVYRDMFVTARNNIMAARGENAEEAVLEVTEGVSEKDAAAEEVADANSNFVPTVYREALDLAKRAYGSYHIAAILCKKDYDLWIRAADTACDIADLMGDISVYNIHAEERDVLLCKKEQEQWYNEAKNDLQTADNLKPPGLDVPIKLASVYMELGHFSEALTLWTDLLQRSSLTEQFRHTAWLLYAECMLHIGHECQQWNAGNEANDNYMFRRWLRKWSSTFDWQERRLQALVLAMEAAAGSNACQHLMAWMRLRDVERRQQVEKRKKEQERQDAEKKDAVTIAKENSSNNTDNVPPANADAGFEEDDIYPDEMDIEDTPDPMAPIEGDAEYEAEKELLLQNNELELNTFDQTTANMKQVLGNDNGDDSQSDKTSALKERRDARKKIVAQHQRQMSKMEDEYKRRAAIDEGLAQEAGAKAQLQEDSILDLDSQHLEASAYTDGRSAPLAASCRTITSIAAELMKHLLEMELYKGGRMAGEAVALYMKERAKVHDKKMQDREKRKQQANPLGSLLLTQTLNYDEVSTDRIMILRLAPLLTH